MKITLFFILTIGLFACKTTEVALNKPWILSYQIDDYDPNSESTFSKNSAKSNGIVILNFINKDSIEAKNFPVGGKKESFESRRHQYTVQKKGVTFISNGGSESRAKKYIANNDSLILIFADQTKYIYQRLDEYNQYGNKSKIEKMIIGNKFTLMTPEGKIGEDINFTTNSEAILSYKIDGILPEFYWTLEKYNNELFLILSINEPFESKRHSKIEVFQITKFNDEKLYVKSYKWEEKVIIFEKNTNE